LKYSDFDEIKVIVEVEGELIAETPVRVGAGRGEGVHSLVDSPLLRIPMIKERILKSVPYIPGSSLKGVLRTECEILAKSMFERSSNLNEILEGIFGSQELASHIICFDAYPTSEVVTFVKPGIRINRTLASVHPGGLYKEEYIAPGTLFGFKLRIINIDLDDEKDIRAQLLKALLRKMKEHGIQVGGRKSIGAGLVRLRKCTIRKFTLEKGELRKISEEEF